MGPEQWAERAAPLPRLVARAVPAGLRQSEVTALRFDNVDLEHQLLYVRQTFSEAELVRPKGGAERVVPLLPELPELLRESMQGKRVGDFLAAEVPSRQNFLHRLKAFQKKAGLRSCGSHALKAAEETAVFFDS